MAEILLPRVESRQIIKEPEETDLDKILKAANIAKGLFGIGVDVVNIRKHWTETGAQQAAEKRAEEESKKPFPETLEGKKFQAQEDMRRASSIQEAKEKSEIPLTPSQTVKEKREQEQHTIDMEKSVGQKEEQILKNKKLQSEIVEIQQKSGKLGGKPLGEFENKKIDAQIQLEDATSIYMNLVTSTLKKVHEKGLGHPDTIANLRDISAQQKFIGTKLAAMLQPGNLRKDEVAVGTGLLAGLGDIGADFLSDKDMPLNNVVGKLNLVYEKMKAFEGIVAMGRLSTDKYLAMAGFRPVVYRSDLPKFKMPNLKPKPILSPRELILKGLRSIRE